MLQIESTSLLAYLVIGNKHNFELTFCHNVGFWALLLPLMTVFTCLV